MDAPAAADCARSIVIIEDNRDAAASLQEILELAGHQVALAFTGPEGVRLAQGAHSDVVVCDIRLLGMDGCAARERLDPVRW